MISRSLGPEFGGAIGLIFSIANAVAASMYIVGFCESINDLLASFQVKIIDGGVNDVRVVGTVTLVVLFAICVIGMEWEARVSGEGRGGGGGRGLEGGEGGGGRGWEGGGGGEEEKRGVVRRHGGAAETKMVVVQAKRRGMRRGTKRGKREKKKREKEGKEKMGR